MKKKQNTTHTVPKTLKRGLLAVFLAIAGGAKEADAQGTPISVGLGAANRRFASGMTVYSPDGENLAVSTGGQSYGRGRAFGYNVATATTPRPAVQQVPVQQVVRQVVQEPPYARQSQYAESAQAGGRSTSDGQDRVLRELMKSVSRDQAAKAPQQPQQKRGSSR